MRLGKNLLSVDHEVSAWVTGYLPVSRVRTKGYWRQKDLLIFLSGKFCVRHKHYCSDERYKVDMVKLGMRNTNTRVKNWLLFNLVSVENCDLS